MDKERAQLATSARCSTEIVEAAFAHGRRRPHVESEDDYCFGAGTVDALKGGGAFFSFASGPRRYLKQPNLRLFDVALRALLGAEGSVEPSAAQDRKQAIVRTSRPAILVSALLFAATGASAAGSGGRVLTTSDVVAIRIVDHPELDTTTRIEPDGTINFPYVGRIKAAGRTEDDLARAVGRRLVELKILAGP